MVRPAVPAIFQTANREHSMSTLPLWYEALREPIGIVIRTDNIDTCISRLRSDRKDAADPELDALSILRSPTDPAELWLIKRTVELPDGQKV